MRGLILYEPTGKALETAKFIAGQDDRIFVCNPFKGCHHGCWYCYNPPIMKMSRDEFKNIKLKGEDENHVINKVKLDLKKFDTDIDWVYLSFSTDPFQNINDTQYNETTLGIIEALKDAGKGIITLTKGTIDKYLNHNYYPDWYGITLVSLSEEFRSKYEIDTKPLKERIEGLKKAHSMGIKTWLSLEPYPTPMLFKQELRPILEEIKFVDKIIFGRWNYDYRACGKVANKFYVEVRDEFIDFCKENSMQYKVKSDTMRLKVI